MPRTRRARATLTWLAAALGCRGVEALTPPPPPPGAPTVASISVSPSLLDVVVGDTVRLTATARDSTGQVVADASVSWASRDSTVASVSAAGLVTARAPGVTQIVAAAGSVRDSTRASVSSPPPPGSTPCASPPSGWIWCDDFESDRLGGYFEVNAAGGAFARVSGVGREGSYGMRARWNASQDDAGALHLAFGRTPNAYVRPVDDGARDYREVYWRVYVRRESGWTGGGGYKLSRASMLVSDQWAQGMIANVWSGSSAGDRDYLVLDPASGTDAAGTLQTTGYNDFGNLRWLGAVRGDTPLFADAANDIWFCVEAHVRLNDPGQPNGVFRLWIDDTLDAEKTGLNWVGNYDAYGINVVFLENYWNNGSPQAQERYFDDFVVSTERIGC